MAANGEIYIKTVEDLSFQLVSAFGRRLTISDTEISKSERTASGKYVKDVVTAPRKITLSYDAIDGSELGKFLSAYESFEEIILRVYTSDINYTDYTVLMEPISRERLVLLDDGLWGNVAIEFNEISRTL